MINDFSNEACKQNMNCKQNPINYPISKSTNKNLRTMTKAKKKRKEKNLTTNQKTRDGRQKIRVTKENKELRVYIYM